jgi:hypothetical protein
MVKNISGKILSKKENSVLISSILMYLSKASNIIPFGLLSLIIFFVLKRYEITITYRKRTETSSKKLLPIVEEYRYKTIFEKEGYL